MTDNPKPSPKPVNNQGEPHEWDIDTVRNRLRHSSEWTRWAAAREVYFRKDAQSRDTLVDLLQNDSDRLVRRMASQALGTLYEMGIEIPLYAHLADNTPEARKKLAMNRMRELGVEVWQQEGYYRLRIPHEAPPDHYLEIGYLMSQLVDLPFQEHCAPFANEPSLVVPYIAPSNTIDYREPDPGAMRFIIYPNGKTPKK